TIAAAPGCMTNSRLAVAPSGKRARSRRTLRNLPSKTVWRSIVVSTIGLRSASTGSAELQCLANGGGAEADQWTGHDAQQEDQHAVDSHGRLCVVADDERGAVERLVEVHDLD